ncbi:MAG TPA: hypothetical protein PLH55_13940 [Spirochaetales bacterium]|nr:hypothetical protein [Spirochaetales bacterium]
MRLYRTTAFAAIALFAAISGAYAQSVSDPIYGYIDRWEARGYLEAQYTLRPYSPEVIIGILERVAEVGSPADAEAAERFLAEYGSSSFDAGLVQRSDARLGGDGFEYRGESGVGLGLLSAVAPGVWAQGVLDVVVVDGYDTVQPATERSKLDVHSDGSMNFLPDGLSGDPMALLYALSSSAWFGRAGLWGSASFSRSSVGPFFGNGVVIGPQATATPNWTMHATTGDWRFSSGLFQLRASDGDEEKYLVYHSYSYSPVSGLDLGIFETTVWGGSFKPLYLVPLSMLFYLQSQSSFGDNSQAGLYGSWRPMDGLQAKATVFFDDVGFSDLVKLELDTKIIGAAEAGLSWAPEAGPLALASLDYTAVFPYMYAHHWTVAEDDYTHAGDSFGAALEPNSDRWELRARFEPLPCLSVEAVSRLLRHGNASEGVTDGDGSWFDDGWVYVDGLWYQNFQLPFEPGTSPKYFRFLTQDTIETTFQLGATVTWNRAFGRTSLSVGLRYLIEAVWNEGLAAGDDELYHYIGLDASWKL